MSTRLKLKERDGMWRGNPYARCLIICGAALTAYGILAPIVTIVRSAEQGLRATSTTATAGSTVVPGVAAASAATTIRTRATTDGAKAVAPTSVVTKNVAAKEDTPKIDVE